jgi:hypothetical protein
MKPTIVKVTRQFHVFADCLLGAGNVPVTERSSLPACLYSISPEVLSIPGLSLVFESLYNGFTEYILLRDQILMHVHPM